MTKPTGRPRGRPKTKEYATLMARFPQELADRLHAYGKLRRLSLSEVLREGAEALLGADDILSYRYKDVSDTNRDMSDMNGAVVPARLGDVPDVSPGYDYVDEPEPMAAALPALVTPSAPPAPAPATEPLGPPPVARAGYGNVTPAVLAALTQQPQPWTCDALAKALQAKNKAVHQALGRLVQQGQVQKQGSGSTATYTLVLEGTATGVGGSRARVSRGGTTAATISSRGCPTS